MSQKQFDWYAKAMCYFVEETTGEEYEPGEIVEGISYERARHLAKLGFVMLVRRMNARQRPQETKNTEVYDGR